MSLSGSETPGCFSWLLFHVIFSLAGFYMEAGGIPYVAVHFSYFFLKNIIPMAQILGGWV